MKKMLPLLGTALGLSLVLGTQAHALNQDKIEKLQNKLEIIQTKLENREAGLGAATISNPEPSTILLLGTGIAAFGVWRWRKRQ